MGGLATKMAQSMGFGPNFPQNPYFELFLAKPPISWQSNIYKSWFFDENEQLFFYKVFAEIGSLGFTEFDRASTRTDASK